MTFLEKIQHEHDVVKYFESEKAQKDLCGTYDHCVCCNKKNKTPCASAMRKFAKMNLKK